MKRQFLYDKYSYAKNIYSLVERNCWPLLHNWTIHEENKAKKQNYCFIDWADGMFWCFPLLKSSPGQKTHHSWRPTPLKVSFFFTIYYPFSLPVSSAITTWSLIPGRESVPGILQNIQYVTLFRIFWKHILKETMSRDFRTLFFT